MIGDRILKNFAVYLDGITMLGEVTEIQLPKITLKTSDWSAAGMSGIVEVDTGKVDKLESVVKFKGIQSSPIKALGIGNSVPLILRAAVKNSDGAVKHIVIEMRGLVKELDYGTLNAEDIGETSVTMSLYYYRLAEDNEDLIELDPINNVRKINGEDQLSEIVSALS
ncbi:phage major tail tube protein [Thiotrichales bacterium 19S3-7]|nr:phage major tail tube protein [Thiotrichales bacterium 19S3-7]MCF6803022.1 phage major tail tube protein [Thiotrichales bacterium 19S3-11]